MVLLIYFGSAGSLSQAVSRRLTAASSAAGLRARGLGGCGSWARGHSLGSCGAQVLAALWHVGSPRSGTKPMSPALTGGLFATEPPEKPRKVFLIEIYVPYNIVLVSGVPHSDLTFRVLCNDHTLVLVTICPI